jgi:hypothetical protein
MNKKGIFYLLLSSLFITVMIIVFLAYKEYSYTDKQKVTETRIMTINDFIRSIDTDSKRVIYISGFRSLIALEDYVAKLRPSHYLDDSELIYNAEEFFKCAFYYGNNVANVTGAKIPGTNCSNSTTQIDVLANSTYEDYLNKLRTIANMIGLDINITVTKITLYQQSSPWAVTVNVTVQINLNDTKGLARWNFTKTYSANVSIISIRDPVYSVATYGKVPNAIRVTNITDFVIDKDPANLMTHIRNMSYNASSLAPSFLMRLEGNFSNSTCCGIESFVYIPQLETQGLIINNSRSIIDYIYFSNDTNITVSYSKITCYVQNITDAATYTLFKFKIDVNHTDYIKDLNYTTCP